MVIEGFRPQERATVGFLSLLGAFFSLFALQVLPSIEGMSVITAGMAFFFFFYLFLAGICTVRKDELVVSLLTSRYLQGVFCVYLFIICPLLLFKLRNEIGITFVDDSIIHMEGAQEVFLSGENPYSFDYARLPAVRGMVELRGADKRRIYAHYAYWPGSFIFPAPLSLLLKKTVGRYEGRLVVWLSFFFIWWSCGFLVRSPLHTGIIRLLLLCNPRFVLECLCGAQNDIFPAALFMGAMVCLEWRRYGRGGERYGGGIHRRRGNIMFLFAGCLLGMAVSIKQTMLVPAFMLVLYVFGMGISKKELGWFISPVLLIPTVIISCYLFQDAGVFLDDTLWYITGGLKDSIPIFAFSLPALAVAAGVISPSYAGWMVWGLRLCTVPLVFSMARGIYTKGRACDVLRYSGLCLCLAFVTGRFCLLKYLTLSLLFFYCYGAVWRMALPENQEGEYLFAMVPGVLQEGVGMIELGGMRNREAGLRGDGT